MSSTVAPFPDRCPERARSAKASGFPIPICREGVAAALAATIFCVDASAPALLGLAGLYGPVLLIATLGGGGRPARGRILGWSLACLLLALCGFGLSQGRDASAVALIHLAIGVFTVLATALLLLRDNAMDVAVHRGHRRYRELFDHVAGAGERAAPDAEVVALRDDLARMQKIGALGAMSATVAHELNQPMTAIQSFCDAARRWAGKSPPDMREVVAALDGLARSVGHAQMVMQRVRALIGNGPLDFADIELTELLRCTAALMRRDALKSGARILVTDCADQAVQVRGDAVLLTQLFVNLLTNAIQAMAGQALGERLVTVSLRSNEAAVIVTVADCGPGWQPGDDAKVFGAFYTTKPQGMGLGLAISRTTVERHGGAITLRSREGGGAVVEVTLPLAVRRDAQASERVRDGSLQQRVVERLVA